MLVFLLQDQTSFVILSGMDRLLQSELTTASNKSSLGICSSHLVIHAIEQSRHHGENGRPQGLHVIWEETDVALIEPNPSSVTVHHRLQTDIYNTTEQ